MSADPARPGTRGGVWTHIQQLVDYILRAEAQVDAVRYGLNLMDAQLALYSRRSEQELYAAGEDALEAADACRFRANRALDRM